MDKISWLGCATKWSHFGKAHLIRCAEFTLLPKRQVTMEKAYRSSDTINACTVYILPGHWLSCRYMYSDTVQESRTTSRTLMVPLHQLGSFPFCWLSNIIIFCLHLFENKNSLLLCHTTSTLAKWTCSYVLANAADNCEWWTTKDSPLRMRVGL